MPPVRSADAPSRDLYLFPDHAVFVNDVLVPVKHLINGSSIVQVPVDDVTTITWSCRDTTCCWRKGYRCESYLDTGDRSNFVNEVARSGLHPDFSVHGGRRWDARRWSSPGRNPDRPWPCWRRGRLFRGRRGKVGHAA